MEGFLMILIRKKRRTFNAV